MTEQNVSFFQVSLFDVDKANHTFIFQPTSLAKISHAQREYITVKITDGREELLFEAMRHNPSVFLSNHILSVRFNIECHYELTFDVASHSKTFTISPLFEEDQKLYDEAMPSTTTHYNNTHKFQLEFACVHNSQYMHPESASAR